MIRLRFVVESDGRTRSGLIQAADEEAARAMIAAKGMRVVELTPVEEEPSPPRPPRMVVPQPEDEDEEEEPVAWSSLSLPASLGIHAPPRLVRVAAPPLTAPVRKGPDLSHIDFRLAKAEPAPPPLGEARDKLKQELADLELALARPRKAPEAAPRPMRELSAAALDPFDADGGSGSGRWVVGGAALLAGIWLLSSWALPGMRPKAHNTPAAWRAGARTL